MDENVSRYLKRIGARGGKARTKNLSPAERSRIARLGGLARWGRPKTGKPGKG